MKKLEKMKKSILKYSCLFTFVLLLFGCSNEFNQPDLAQANTEPPIINSVADATLNVTVSTGVLGNTYYIKGQNLKTVKSIKFNGSGAGFNPTLATETLIIAQVPREAPFIGESNKLVVETLYGTAEYNFSLLTITDFAEGILEGVNAVTLNGGDFTDADQVLFVSGSEELDNLEEREATILSKSESSISVEVPAGIIQAFIYVYVNGAIAQSKSYGFNYPIFTDAIINDWGLGGWDGTQAVSDEVALGSNSIRRDSNNWSGLTLNAGDNTDVPKIADYSAINFQIFPANSETVRVACALNDFETQVVLDLVPGEWNSFSVPLTDFYAPGTAPETISRVDFQEFSGGNPPFLFYLDQFGLIE